jgi:hypothetical protein
MRLQHWRSIQERRLLLDMLIRACRSTAKAERNHQGGHNHEHIGSDILHLHARSSLLGLIVIDQTMSNRVRRRGD